MGTRTGLSVFHLPVALFRINISDETYGKDQQLLAYTWLL